MSTSIIESTSLAILLVFSLCSWSSNLHQRQSRDAHQDTHPLPTRQQIDAEVHRMMAATRAKGIAIAVIDKGQVAHVLSYGSRNAAGDSAGTRQHHVWCVLTKTAFAYLVLQLVDRGKLDLDRSIAQYLPKPLPDYRDPEIAVRYARWSDLAGDDRWKKLTPRMLLNHASGFSNFGFLEPDGKLKFHFDPGTRYSYSGDGIILLQFVLEKGLGLNVGEEMQKGIFDPLGMKNTSLIWRNDFSGRTADGWTIDGKTVPHDDRSKVRAAGSMDTTISDITRLAAAIARGDLVSAAAREDFDSATASNQGRPVNFRRWRWMAPADRQVARPRSRLGCDCL